MEPTNFEESSLAQRRMRHPHHRGWSQSDSEGEGTFFIYDKGVSATFSIIYLIAGSLSCVRRSERPNSNSQLLHLVLNLGQNLHKQLRLFVPNSLLHHRLQCPHPCSTAR